jgi:hypothetical protein
MVVEVEKTGAAVGFLDHECLCLTTLNNTDNTLAFSVSVRNMVPTLTSESAVVYPLMVDAKQ